METVKKANGSLIIWMDFSKLGRLSMADLNTTIDLASSILQKNPSVSVGIAVCPILISEKVRNGVRGECRNFGKIICRGD